MKAAYLITCFLLSLPFSIFAQQDTIKENHLEFFEYLGTATFLVKRDWPSNSKGSFFIKKIWYRGGIEGKPEGERVIEYHSLDSVMYTNPETSFGPGAYPEEIHIQFANENVGFLYGYGVVYDYYPFLYRTEDGGRTWKLIKLETGQLYKNSLFMFDANRGILLKNAGYVNKYEYFATNDGGLTWQEKTIHPTKSNLKEANKIHVPFPVYNHQGIVTIVFDGKHVFQSTDFGQSFKYLK
jgi:hypothetical protein